MPTQFKVEIFQRNYTFKSFAPISDPRIAMDYLTLEKTKIKAAGVVASKGDYAHVTDGTGNVVYQGIVDDVEAEKSGITLTVKPLLSIFDCNVHFDRSESSALETFLAGIITAHFVSNADRLQNIGGMEVVTTSSTTGRLNLKDNVHALYDIIAKCLTGYGITVSMVLLPQSQKLMVKIGKANGAAVIEADLPGIVEKSFIIGDSYGQLNKVTVINKDNETQQANYYLHSDGTISSVNADRIVPVFFSAEYIEAPEDFGAESYSRAYEILAPQKYDNLIELTVPNESGILQTDMAMGTEVTILSGDNGYTSVLTGYERTGLATKMIFGVVRAELTKRLILERRKA